MESLLVVTGPPGSGKSTLATVVAARSSRSVLVEGDAFFGFLAEGSIAPWLPESNEQNHTVIEACGLAAGRFVTGGYDTVVDGIIGPWFLPTFHEASGIESLDWVVLMPTEEICRQRVEQRARAGFADLDATSRMHHEFSTSAIDDRHLLDSGSMTPDELADVVATRRSNEGLQVRR